LTARRRWPDWVEGGLLVAIAPFLLFPGLLPEATLAALAFLLIGALGRWVIEGRPLPVTPLNGSLLLWEITVGVGVLVTALPDLTLPKATGLLLGLAVWYYLVWFIDGRERLRWATTALFLLGMGLTVMGVLAAEWRAKVPVLATIIARLPSALVNLPGAPEAGVSTNQLGGTVVFYLLLTLSLLFGVCLGRRKARRGRGDELGRWVQMIGFSIGVLIFGGVLVLTQSRSAWIGCVGGFVVLLALWGWTLPRSLARLWVRLALFIALCTIIGALLWIGPERLQRFWNDPGGMTALGALDTWGFRGEVWRWALVGVQDFPFTGCGLGAFRQVVQILYPIDVPPGYDIAHAHNMFLQVALDVGIPGLIAYLALLGGAAVAAWRAAWANARLRPLALGLLGGMVALHAYGLIDALAPGSKPGVAFWFALGLIAALPRVAEQERLEPKDESKDSYALRFTQYPRIHPWLTVIIALFVVAILVTGAYLAWRALPEASPAPPAIRLPLYPEAQGVDVHTEAPPAGAGWVGSLEIATFTTTHPIADVASFYTTTLAEVGWQTEVEAGDETSWGGIYTQEGGLSVCLLNAFAPSTGSGQSIEGETWVSIVCGDKAEPVDIPPLPSNE
jgi:putative inorganic carbon (HCO3(-)) transporter